MNCKNCGYQLTANDLFCKNCGTRVEKENMQNYNGDVNNQNNTLNEPIIETKNNSGINEINFSSLGQNSFNEQPINNYNGQLNSFNSQSSNNFNPQLNNFNSQSSNNFNPQQMGQVNNGYNQNFKNGNQNKNNDIKFVVIGMVIVFLLAGIIFGINVFKGKNKNNSDVVLNNNSTTNTYAYLKGFKFTIPEDVFIKNSMDQLILYNATDTWEVSIEMVDKSYELLKISIEGNKSAYQSGTMIDGMFYKNYQVKTISGREYLVLEVLKNNINFLVAFTKADSNYTIGLTMITVKNDCDYSLLNKINPIVSSIKNVSTSSISSNLNKDLNDAVDKFIAENSNSDEKN